MNDNVTVVLTGNATRVAKIDVEGPGDYNILSTKGLMCLCRVATAMRWRRSAALREGGPLWGLWCAEAEVMRMTGCWRTPDTVRNRRKQPFSGR